MLLSDKTIDLLDEGKLTELIDGAEFPREKFLKGGGALVVGFSFVGSLLAGSAKGAAARVAAGPPNAALIDSWVAIHADNTATIAFGKIDITGAPTGLLQIAAEELDLTIQQVTGRRVEHRHHAEPGPHGRQQLDLERRPAGTPGGRRGPGCAARARVEAARRPGLAADRPRGHRLGQGRRVEEGRLRRSARRQDLLRSEHRQGAAEARHGVQARRPAGEAEGHARRRWTARIRTCTSFACPGCCTGGSSGRRARGPTASSTSPSRSTRARSRTSREPASFARATSSASSPRTSRTRSRRPRS